MKRATAAEGPYILIGQSDTGSYTDETVMDGNTFFYKVDAGDSGAGGPVSDTPQPPFVSSFASLGAPENNLNTPDAFLGMAITIAGNPVTVYALGRMMVAGNNAAHEIRIVDANNFNNVVASVVVNMAGGTVGSFVYTALPSPVVLNANGKYYVVSHEQNGRDSWHRDTTTLLTTSVATVTSSIIGNGGNFLPNSPGMVTFGPLDFLYL